MNTFLEAACLLDLPVLMHYILNVKKVILLFLFLTLNTLVLLSNDGSYSIMGSAGSVLIPVKNNAISMQKEDIKMDVYKHQDICSYKIMYDCTFYFINETDKIQRVTIGFPHRLNSFVGWDYETPIHQEITAPTTPVFRDFKFIIDGKEVTYWSYRTGKNDALKDVPAYDVVCAVNVTFVPGEKRIRPGVFEQNHPA